MASRFSGQIWSPSQANALLIFAAVVMVVLSLEAHREPGMIGDPQNDLSLHGSMIADRLDPNTADVAALAEIPNLGEKKAVEIVEYRDAFIHQHPSHQHPTERAFAGPNDLMHLKGFGPATVKNLEPFLIFSSPNGPR